MNIEIINKLIELGRLDNLDDPSIAADFEQFRPYEYLGRIHWREWYPVCESLAVDDHIALLKAVVMAMRYAGWDGGSVAPCIWVYNKLEERVSNKVAREMAAWVIDRCDNPWAPFGTQKARKLFIAAKDTDSADDYSGSLRLKLLLMESAECAERACLSENCKEQHIAKAKRLEERKLDVDKHQKRKDEKAHIRRQVITVGEQMSAVGRLQLIIDNEETPLLSFPSTWAEVPLQALKGLDESLRNALVHRLTGQKKGPWKKLRDCLDTSVP
jgi:hypothetical protein